mgnify:CR=1 FL=1
MSILNKLSIENKLKEFFSYTNGNILYRREGVTVEFKGFLNEYIMDDSAFRCPLRKDGY